MKLEQENLKLLSEYDVDLYIFAYDAKSSYLIRVSAYISYMRHLIRDYVKYYLKENKRFEIIFILEKFIQNIGPNPFNKHGYVQIAIPMPTEEYLNKCESVDHYLKDDITTKYAEELLKELKSDI